MRVKLELYRTFLEVAKTGNISLAAQNLYISQSAVSQSIRQLEEQLEDLRTINPKIEMKVLMTMKQRNKTTEQVEEWLRGPGSSWKCFETPIRRSIVVEKATMAREPLPEFARNCAATKDYREVVEELLRDMEG